MGSAGGSLDAEKLIFHGGRASDGSMVVKKAGVVAICYCATPGANSCASGNYLFIGHIMVRGPRGGEVFRFSVGEIFALEFEGHGLDSTNRLRITTSPCDASNSTAPSNSEAHLYQNCPGNCR